jgi:hypothetical protein
MLLLVDLLLLVFAVVQGMQAPTKCECENIACMCQSIHIQYIPTTICSALLHQMFFYLLKKKVTLGTNFINW